MLPTEFLSAFGSAVVLKYVSVAAKPTRIMPNPDRYLLVFWSTSGVASIMPDTNEDDFTAAQSFAAADDPIEMTHAKHGAMVNMGWSVKYNNDGFVLTTIEAYMKTGVSLPQLNYATVGSPYNPPRSITQQFPPTEVVPPEVVIPTLNIEPPPRNVGRHRRLIRMGPPPISPAEELFWSQAGFRIEYPPEGGAWAVPI